MRALGLVAVLLLVASSSLVAAHVDAFFTISTSGAVIGVPDEFGPVSVKVVYYDRESKNAPDTLVIISIGDAVTKLSPCVSRLFMQPPTQQLHAHGSWYHDLTLLPPYLLMDIPYRVPADDVGSFHGYSLMFNLDTGHLIEIRKVQQGPSGHGIVQTSLSEAEACSDDRFQGTLGPEPSRPAA